MAEEMAAAAPVEGIEKPREYVLLDVGKLAVAVKKRQKEAYAAALSKEISELYASYSLTADEALIVESFSLVVDGTIPGQVKSASGGGFGRGVIQRRRQANGN